MATFERHADVSWSGSVTEGGGEITAGTGAFALPVTFPARVGESGRDRRTCSAGSTLRGDCRLCDSNWETVHRAGLREVFANRCFRRRLAVILSLRRACPELAEGIWLAVKVGLLMARSFGR